MISTTQAQLPHHRLDSITPSAAKPGTDSEVTLAGEVADVTSLIFDGPGITATKLDGPKFKLTIAADAPRGLREVRATGKLGISAPRMLLIGDGESVVDNTKNHSPATAQPVNVPCAITGTADADASDFYKFTAKAGQKLAITCLAYALDSRMDGVLAVRDAKGRVLARSLDARDRDAALEFSAPADGEYLAEVHDHLFAGGGAYLLTCDTGAAPVSEASAREGRAVPLSRPAAALVLDLPAAPMTAETEPNDKPEQAQKLALPADVSGTLDREWFVFDAVKGKAYRLDVISERIGERSDALLIVRKSAADKPLLEADDTGDVSSTPRFIAGTRDPGGRVVAAEDGPLLVQLINRTSTRAARYRLLIREEAPDFSLLAMPESPVNENNRVGVWQPSLRAGGTAHYVVAAMRRGYDGEIALRAEGLPDGVSATGRIAAGSATGMLVFHAKPDAKAWAGLFKITGEGGGTTRTARGVTYRWNVENRDAERLDARLTTTALAVVEQPAPLVIAPAEQKEWEAPLGGTLEIPLKLTRPAPLATPKGEWTFAPVSLAGLGKFEPVKFDGGAANDVKLVVKLENKDGAAFAAGTQTIFIRARGVVAVKADEKAKPADVRHIEFSTPIVVKIIEPPKAAAAK